MDNSFRTRGAISLLAPQKFNRGKEEHMIQKQELIESIENWAPGKADRKILESKTIDQLKDILAEAVTTFQEEKEERLLQTQAERAANRALHEWNTAQAQEPQRKAEAVERERSNRCVFAEAAKTLGISGVEANYSVLVQALGELSVFGIRDFLTANPTALVGATEKELQEREAERIKQHNQRLLNAGPIELREATRQESEERRALAQRQEIERRITVQEERDKAIGFDPLPSHNSEGQVIDRAYLLRLADSDIKKYRLFCSHYGSANITARLNGVR